MQVDVRVVAVAFGQPAVDRDELIGRRIRSMAEKLCGGSLATWLGPAALAR